MYVKMTKKMAVAGPQQEVTERAVDEIVLVDATTGEGLIRDKLAEEATAEEYEASKVETEDKAEDAAPQNKDAASKRARK